ncbi:MAG: hypothetical protein OEU54_06430 [Gemmatimonadota bacterium]|nr:hypothetical protein [Gemmatimonadota bacterium]
MPRSKWFVSLTAAIVLVVSACNSTPSNGGTPGATQGQILVLNSISKTIVQFNVDDNTLVPFGSTFTLPANYDGVAMDILGDLMVTTVSSFNGSQVIWGDLGTGQIITTGFGGASGGLANPGKPTLVVDTQGTIGALVGAREENRVYISFPSEQNAILIADDAGEFIERVLPFGQLIFTADANLDDVGGTYAPLGDTRMKLFRFNDGSQFDDFELTGAKNVTDAVFSQEQIIVLAGGSFTPQFLPTGDGAVVVVNAPDRGVRAIRALDGNGLAFEPGRNGLGYVVRTNAGTFDSTDIVTFNFFTETFDRGPANPIQPKDADGSDIENCRVASALVDSRLLCATFEDGSQGRLVLMDASGNFLDDAPIGAGASDIFVR